MTIAFGWGACSSEEAAPLGGGLGRVDESGELVVGDSVEEECTDPVNCEGSEAAEEEAIDEPFVPEEWTPPPDPGPEVQCNGVDEDGDGVDYCSGDADGDGTFADYDCDDNDPTRYNAAPEELCDGIDSNCDGEDECDSDGDGYMDEDDCDPSDPEVSNHCFPGYEPESGE